MSITLLDLGAQHGSFMRASVQNGVCVFAALVNGSRESLEPLLGLQTPVEISFEKMLNWQEMSDFQDDDSCIKAGTIIQDTVIVRGRVHKVLPIDSESSVIDLYVQTAQEFIAIESSELGGFIPKIGTGLEIHIQGLCFYPTNI
ncbi:hypothetical protein [Massilia sp. BJB1822]|uniref:hypothetical protein n=1 Tax=Massilia sp. BJB1822 TaxID=2744470 RepID=UPI001592DA2F|nr:hypothetical protein [Massilia sp. BJB1822]NVD97852.1 hypothetical protein [Massilia sp. BJB1822]